MRYFTSDQHFFDSDIISYSDRPYATPEEMNEDLARRFVERTRDASEVFIVGDVFGGRRPPEPYEACAAIMERLGIRARPFHLILGNHDTLTAEEYARMGFRSVKSIDFIELNGMRTMLTHDPCMVQPRDTLAICGHIHTLFSENWQPARNTLTINVSVEVRNYEPVSEAEIAALVERYPYRR